MKQSVYITSLHNNTYASSIANLLFFLPEDFSSRRLYILIYLDLIAPFVGASDMSQGSRGYKSKTGPKQTQKENIPKQRKYKYFTSLQLWSLKFKNRFYQKNSSYHREYLTPKYSTSQQVFFTKFLNKFLHKETSQIVKNDCKMIIGKKSC